MSGSDDRLSGKLAEAIREVYSPAGRVHGKTHEMIDRCANAAEMGVRIAFLTQMDPMKAAEVVLERDGTTLVEQRSPRGKLQSTSVRFKGGGEVLFTRSRMRAKTFGASEIVTEEG